MRTYRGKYKCPKCGSLETGSNTIATSRKWIDFVCDCGCPFRKLAVTVSTLSKSMEGKEIKKGDTIDVYQDPLTECKYEGKVKLIKHVVGFTNSHGLKMWHVKFLADGMDALSVMRWVKV